MSERDELVARLRGWDHCWPAPWLEGAVQDAADQIERDGREIERMRASLRDAEETLALVEAPPHADPNIRDEVSALGQRVGFGALMVTASALWTESLAQGGYPTGGAFVGGPCRGTVEGTLARIRAALSGEGET